MVTVRAMSEIQSLTTINPAGADATLSVGNLPSIPTPWQRGPSARTLNHFIAHYEGMPGLAFIEAALEHCNLSYRVSDRDQENIPSQGRVFILVNQPASLQDVLAMMKMVGEIRPDVRLVDHPLVQGITQLEPMLLKTSSVNTDNPWPEIQQALVAEQAVVLFPAESVSPLSTGRYKDTRWNPTFLNLAARLDVPLVPLYVDMADTGMLSRFIRLSALRERFSSRGRVLGMSVGELIPHRVLAGSHLPQKTQCKLLRKHLYRIGQGRPGIFPSEKAIAPPLSARAIRAEIRQARQLGQTLDGKFIYILDYAPDSVVLKEIGRLREVSFRQAGEGSGKRRDLDKYDQYYRHLVLWDDEALEIVGSYRLGVMREVMALKGLDGVYSHTLFHFGQEFESRLNHAIELGRSFVQPKYWGGRALDYLWQGIGAFLRHHPCVRYLFGPVSISDHYPPMARNAIIWYYRHYHSPSLALALARMPVEVSSSERFSLASMFNGADEEADFRVLKNYLKQYDVNVPTLYKQYTDVCEPGGVEFLAFNIDPDFSNCVDGLICVDLSRLKPAKRKRYVGDEEAEPQATAGC